MRLRALCIGSTILALSLGLAAASAQEATFDPKALDAAAAAAVKPKAAKKAKAQPAPQAGAPAGRAAAGKPGAQPGGPNRQFGELEGWSPGKAPPKPGEKDTGSTITPPKGAGVGVSPSGNMSVGLPF